MNSIKYMVGRSVLFVLLLLVGCNDHSALDEGLNDWVPDKELYITLDISIPQIAYPYRAVNTRSTYRPQSFDETYLESIDVLIFKQAVIQGEVAEFYVGHTRSEREDIVNCDGSLKQFSVKIKKSVDDEKFRLVVLANASVEIDEVEKQFTPMLTKREVFELISFDTSTAWNSADDTYRCLPMWGQTDAAFAISSTTTGASLGVIPMLRAVARIDVGVDISAQKTSKSNDTLDSKPLFVIDEIRVCNANLKSQVAPYSVEGKG